MIEGSRGGTSKWLKLIDVNEQYGRHVMKDMAHRVANVKLACDLGVGGGHDLSLVKESHPDAQLVGVDFFEARRAPLKEQGIDLQVKNIEIDELDFADESVDLFVANQVYEHLKEIFWVSHQISKKLKVGGSFILGVPNICAFHNRVLFLLGKQPSQMKSYSAHVRGYAPKELLKFIEVCFPGGYKLEKFAGAQFYPFPKWLARPLSKLFPSLCHSVFYLLTKVKPYENQFIEHPIKAELETNFYTGPVKEEQKMRAV